MPTNRTRIHRAPSRLDDFRAAEALTLCPPLIQCVGFYDRTTGWRDERAIEAAWRTHRDRLVRMWIAGWLPTEEFISPFKPGRPGTRPAGWWRHCAPEPQRRGETEAQYLSRLALWLDGEQEMLASA
jgi:hypothetical protein